MMATAAAANAVDGFRTGMVLVAQTSGILLNVHPTFMDWRRVAGGIETGPG